MPVPDGYTLIPAPTPGPPPGYTLDRAASMAPNQTNPQADTTGGQALGTNIPQTTPPPGAKYRPFVEPRKAAAPVPEQPTVEAAPGITYYDPNATQAESVKPAAQQRGNSQWDAPVVDPQRLQTLARFGMGQGNKPLVEEIRGVVWDKAHKHMREDFLWRDPGGNYRDDKGNKLDPDLVDRRAQGARGGAPILQHMEIHDPGGYFGHSTILFNPMTGEYSREAGNERPLPEEKSKFGFAESEAAVAFKNAQAYSALEQKRVASSNEITKQYQNAKETYERDKAKKDFQGLPIRTDPEYRAEMDRLTREYFGKGGIKEQSEQGFNRAQKALERDPFAGIRHPAVISALGSDAAPIINGSPSAATVAPTATPPASHGNVKTGGASTFGNWAH